MIEVRLHGPLARFGKVWNLDVRSPAEAVNAIDRMKGGFRKLIWDLHQKGFQFRVRTKNFDYTSENLLMTVGSANRLDIIPILMGSSAGVRFVIGAVLVVAGFALYGSGSPVLGQALISAGASMMIGSVAEMLAPKVKKEDLENNAKNWTLSGPSNTSEQGVPIPIIYGEVLTGSHVVSSSLVSEAYTPGSILSTAVEINGDDYEWTAFNIGPHVETLVIERTTSIKYLVEPYTWSWSVVGFNGAIAKRVTGQNTNKIRIELDYNVNVFEVVDTGSISVQLTGGYEIGKTGEIVPSQTVSDTMNMRVSLSAIVNDGGQ